MVLWSAPRAGARRRRAAPAGGARARAHSRGAQMAAAPSSPRFNPAFTTAAGVVKHPDASRRWTLASALTFKIGDHTKCFFVGRAPPRVGAAAVLSTKPEYTSKGSYAGGWSGNLQSGTGTRQYPDGSRYEGCWAFGKREGQGSLYVRRGARLMLDYTGNWEGGRKQGFGKQAYSSGDVCVWFWPPTFHAAHPPPPPPKHQSARLSASPTPPPLPFRRSYEGAFADGRRHGQGQQFYADGSVYRGEWRDDQRHGMGELVLPNGDMYRGAWEAGEKHGEGSYVYAAKGRVLHGEWVRGLASAGELRSHEGAGVGESASLPELGLANADAVIKLAMAEARLSGLVGRPPSTAQERSPTRGTATSQPSLGFTDPFPDSRPATGSSAEEPAGRGGLLAVDGGWPDEDLGGLSPVEAAQLFRAFCVVEGGDTGFIPADPGALAAVLESLSVQGDLSDLREMLQHLVEDSRGSAPEGFVSFPAFARAMVNVKEGAL